MAQVAHSNSCIIVKLVITNYDNESAGVFSKFNNT